MDMPNHLVGIVQNGYHHALAGETDKLRVQDLPGEAPHDVHFRPQEISTEANSSIVKINIANC